MGVVWNPKSEFLREPNLLIPGKKPTGSVRIDWSNPITRGLYITYGEYHNSIYGDPSDNRDLTTQKRVVLSASGDRLVKSIAPSGKATAINNISLYFKYTDALMASSTDFTWMTHLVNRATASHNLWGSTSRCYLRITNSNQIEFLARYLGEGTITVKLTSDTLSVPSEPVVILSHDTGVKQFLSINGITEDSASEADNMVAAFSIDRWFAAIGISTLNNAALSGFLWKRALSESECASLGRDPYQFLIPA